MNEKYTPENWLKEGNQPLININTPFGPFPYGSIIPCPNCYTIGFYAPRTGERDGKLVRKYRACKFCGFWQEAWGEVWDDREKNGEEGGAVYFCNMFFHNCESEKIKYLSDFWRNVYGYDWIKAAKTECQFCGKIITNIADWPIKDFNHPFHKIKSVIEEYLESNKLK